MSIQIKVARYEKFKRAKKNEQEKYKKNKNTPKETHSKQNKAKEREKKTNYIFPNDFLHVVYLFLHQTLLSTNHLVIEITLSVRCHYFVKAIAFFELFKTISFSIL